MRIALMIEEYHPYTNGVVTHVDSLKHALEKMGHTVLVVASNPNLKKHVLKDGVLECPAVELKKIYDYGLSSPISRERFRILKSFRPDVIHIHQEYGIGLFGLLSAKKLGVPLVYTLHSMYDEYIFYVAPGLLEKPAKAVFFRYLGYIGNRAAVVLSPSAKAVRILRECGVKKKVHVVPNGVDLDVFNRNRFSKEQVSALRARYKIPADSCLGFFVGRLGKEKSVDFLLEEWARSFKGNLKMQLLIAGDGPEAEPLHKMVSAFGLEKQVHFAGKIDHEQVPFYASACDYYISASLTEMMSISMMESMSCGLPAVLRLDPANASQIHDGVDGFLFRDGKEMREVLTELAAQSEEEWNVLHDTVHSMMEPLSSYAGAQKILGYYQKAVDYYKKKRPVQTHKRRHRLS